MQATAQYIESSDTSRDSSLQFFNYKTPVNSTQNPAVGIMDILDSLGTDLVDDFQSSFNHAVLVSFVTMPDCAGNCTDEENSNPPAYRQDVGDDPQLITRLRVINTDAQRINVEPPWEFTANASVLNMFNALLFAARVDIGRATTNNFFTNTSAINSTIQKPLVANSYAQLFMSNETGRNGYARLPISANPSTIWLSYACHTLRLKSIVVLLGSLVVCMSRLVDTRQ